MSQSSREEQQKRFAAAMHAIGIKDKDDRRWGQVHTYLDEDYDGDKPRGDLTLTELIKLAKDVLGLQGD